MKTICIDCGEETTFRTHYFETPFHGRNSVDYCEKCGEVM